MVKTNLAENVVPITPDPVWQTPSHSGELSHQSVYQQLVDAARKATGATNVWLNRYDSDSEIIQTLAFSGFESSFAMQALRQARFLFPAFDPANITYPANANSFLEKVYQNGEAVSVPVLEYMVGIIDELLARMYSSILGVNYVSAFPIKEDGGMVIGSLSFHCNELFDSSRLQICETFANKVSIVGKNDTHQSALNHQILSLRESRSRIVAAEEQVRKDIAEMLHGKVQTKLLVAWHELGRCAALVDTDAAEAKTLLEQVRKEVDQIREQDIREASHLLHPSVVRVGLIPALKSLARKFTETVDVSITCDSGIAELDNVAMNQICESVRLAAYRVVEEALNNVVKPSGATSAEISLKFVSRRRLQITVCDNGQGFIPKNLRMGLGLSSLDDRIESLGGSWNISASIGFGTTLTAFLPLNQD